VLQSVKNVFPYTTLFRSQLLDHVSHSLGIIGTQVADIPQLAKVQLDGDELAVHIDLPDTGLFDQFLKLGWQSVSESHRAEIRKINLCFSHSFFTPVLKSLFL
jgi:hypothetical protein